MTSQPAEHASSPVSGRRVIVGLGGGIACYKVAMVVSRLVQSGADVTVAMTEGAAKFVTPLTFEALSGRPVYSSVWDRVESHDPQHIALARSARCMLIAPATMDLIAKLATGRTDDVVTLIASAIDRRSTPVLVAPSMNAVMLEQPSTQRNLATLREDGFEVIEPGVGWQACRTTGAGRLAEPEALVERITSAVRRAGAVE